MKTGADVTAPVPRAANRPYLRCVSGPGSEP